LERLVLFSAIEVDKAHGTHVEYASGLLLLRTCLFQFVLSAAPSALVTAVAATDPLDSPWRLDARTFELWQNSGARILAEMHAMRTQTEDFSRDEFYTRGFHVNPDDDREVVLDGQNRAVYVEHSRGY
jgi:hypothetical protein